MTDDEHAHVQVAGCGRVVEDTSRACVGSDCVLAAGCDHPRVTANLDGSAGRAQISSVTGGQLRLLTPYSAVAAEDVRRARTDSTWVVVYGAERGHVAVGLAAA